MTMIAFLCTIVVYPITRVRGTKFLGVIIDEKLTWKDRVSLVRSKLSKTVGISYMELYIC